MVPILLPACAAHRLLTRTTFSSQRKNEPRRQPTWGSFFFFSILLDANRNSAEIRAFFFFLSFFFFCFLPLSLSYFPLFPWLHLLLFLFCSLTRSPCLRNSKSGSLVSYVASSLGREPCPFWLAVRRENAGGLLAN